VGEKDDANGLNEVNDRYPWTGRCGNDYSSVCQPDAIAATTCMAATGGAVGCAQCTGSVACLTGNGDSATTIWKWIDELNIAMFAGHSDWRVPTLAELQTILFPDGSYLGF
jgi:hypothetical protein